LAGARPVIGSFCNAGHAHDRRQLLRPVESFEIPGGPYARDVKQGTRVEGNGGLGGGCEHP